MRGPQLLRTRVARRILGLFLVCAILPVATFAILTYRLTADRLESDAENALRLESKATGMILMDRLHGLVNELRSSGPRASYEATVVELSDGRLGGGTGALTRFPGLSKDQSARLSSGRPVVLVDTARGRPWIFVVLPTPGRASGFPRTWGMAAPSSIVGADPQLNPAPDGTALCLLDDIGRSLHCPQGEGASALRSARASVSSLTWERGDTSFFMASWSLFLGGEFAAPAWSVALSRPRSSILIPLSAFRRTFLLGVALAAVLVFVLSHAQLRKRMTPLVELEAGVRRLSAGDFATPVLVKSDDEFEMLAASFNGMAADLSEQLMTLKALSTVGAAALETRSAPAIANAALRCAPALLGASRAVIAFESETEAGIWMVMSAGPEGKDRRAGRASIAAGELLQLEASVDVLDIPPGTPGHSYFDAQHLPRTEKRIVFPLRHHGRIRGALAVSGRGSPFPPAVLACGRQLADQLAVGLANVALLGELDALGHGSLLALARTIDAASPWTAGHSERVTHGALEIGRRLGFDRATLDRLRRGGLLHDIGKIGVPASILDKAGSLTAEERATIQMHPVIGARILKPIAAFLELEALVLYHHELLDGTGYPEGLAGDEIPPMVRVLTVADVFDALVSDRPYRAGLTPAAALAILREDAGTKFDARAVGCLEDAVRGGWSAATIAGPVIENLQSGVPETAVPAPRLHLEVYS